MGQSIHYNKGTLAIETTRPAFDLPEGCKNRGEYHVTILDPADIKVLKPQKGMSNSQFDAWLKSFEGQTISGKWTSLGVGTATKGDNTAYFEVISWPEAQRWRKDLGLGEKDLHITIGFIGSDVHGVPKDKSTLIASGPLAALASELVDISSSLE